jgi:hypothetical protein
VYIPQELEHTLKLFHVASKVPMQKVMFFGTVAKPRPNRDFNGRILLVPICSKKKRQRGLKYGCRGEDILAPITMTMKIFMNYYLHQLLPAIWKHIKRLLEVKKVIIQMNRVSGHGRGRKDIQSTLNKLNSYAKRKKKRNNLVVTFIAQPSKSLDFNVLDLGIWYSLFCGVPTVKDGEGRVINRIIVNILNCWNDWDAWTRLNNVFEMKKRILKYVRTFKGTNKYKIPRSKKSHKNDKPSFMPKQPEESDEKKK